MSKYDTFGFLEKRKTIVVSVIFLSLVLMFQNCSLVSPPSALNNSGVNENISGSQITDQKALSVLENRCASCHNPDNPSGDLSDITDLNYLLFYRLVIPGQPEISDLIRVIKEGSMPPSGPLSNAELDILNNWILSGLVDNGESITLPGGAAQLEAKFSSIQARILNPQCVSCHNATRMDGGVNLSTYAAVMNEIQSADPTATTLMMAIERAGADYMPRGGARLSADDISKMKMWIQSGAMNN